MRQPFIERVRQNIHAIALDLFTPNNAQGCDDDIQLLDLFCREIGSAIRDNGDFV